MSIFLRDNTESKALLRNAVLAIGKTERVASCDYPRPLVVSSHALSPADVRTCASDPLVLVRMMEEQLARILLRAMWVDAPAVHAMMRAGGCSEIGVLDEYVGALRAAKQIAPEVERGG